MSESTPEKALAELLADFDTGMRVFVAASQEEADRIGAAQEAEGWHCACISNAGLPSGQYRLTFLPRSALADTQDSAGGDAETGRTVAGPPVSKRPQRDVRDLLADIDKIVEVPYEHDHPTILPEGLRIVRETIATCAPSDGRAFRAVDILVEDTSGDSPRRLQTRGMVFDEYPTQSGQRRRAPDDALYVARIVALGKAIEWHGQLLDLRGA